MFPLRELTTRSGRRRESAPVSSSHLPAFSFEIQAYYYTVEKSEISELGPSSYEEGPSSQVGRYDRVPAARRVTPTSAILSICSSISTAFRQHGPATCSQSFRCNFGVPQVGRRVVLLQLAVNAPEFDRRLPFRKTEQLPSKQVDQQIGRASCRERVS